MQSELKEVDKLLKLDPTNTTLLAQRQKLLAESITNTKTKLETLKNAEEQVQQQFKEGKVGEEQYRALQREVIKTEGSLKSLEGQAIKANAVLTKDQAVGNLKNIAKTAAVGAAAVGTAFIAMGAAAVNNADELQRQADVTGLSAEKLQELQYVGSNLGVELDTITGAQAKLTKSMDAAKGGTGAQAEAFKALGISVVDSDGHLKNSQDVMSEAFTALGKVGNETERDALSMQIFGKSAMDLNPLIKAGGGELNKLSEEAKNNGAVMSNEAVAGLDAFGDKVDNIKSSVLGNIGEMLADLMPQIQSLIDKLIELPKWIKENSTLLTVIGIIIGTITALIIIFNIQTALSAAGLTVWSAIAGIATGITTGLGTAFAFLTSPIALIILAIGLLIIAGVLLYKHWDTVKAFAISIFSAIGSFITTVWNNIKNTTATVWNNIKNGVSGAISGVKNAVINGLSSAVNWIKDLPGQALQWGKDMIQGLINGIKSMIGKIGNAVEGIANKIKSFLHFSVPDVGPLADYESWMPDFMSGLAKGIEKSKGVVANAVKGLSTDISIGVKNNPAFANSPNGSTVNNQYDSILHTDKVVINNGMDIQTLAEELEFYRRKAAASQGEA